MFAEMSTDKTLQHLQKECRKFEGFAVHTNLQAHFNGVVKM